MSSSPDSTQDFRRGDLVWAEPAPGRRHWGLLFHVVLPSGAAMVAHHVQGLDRSPNDVACYPAGMWGVAVQTPEMRRVLAYLLVQGEACGYSPWLHISRLETAPGLQEDDVVCLPGLIDRGLVDHRVAQSLIRLTGLGVKIAIDDAMREC